MPKLRFHGLRHPCATIRFMREQHPKRVHGLVGHASVASTLEIYGHVIPDTGKDDVVEGVLS